MRHIQMDSIDDFLEFNYERIEKQIRSAIKDAVLLDRAFIIVKRVSVAYGDLEVKHIPWQEVEYHLNHMGVRLEEPSSKKRSRLEE